MDEGRGSQLPVRRAGSKRGDGLGDMDGEEDVKPLVLRFRAFCSALFGVEVRLELADTLGDP